MAIAAPVRLANASAAKFSLFAGLRNPEARDGRAHAEGDHFGRGETAPRLECAGTVQVECGHAVEVLAAGAATAATAG